MDPVLDPITHVIHNPLNEIETGKEADLVLPRELVRNARDSGFSSNDRVVGREELELCQAIRKIFCGIRSPCMCLTDDIADLGHNCVWNELMIALFPRCGRINTSII